MYTERRHATEVELGPAGEAEGAVIWLHGLGADGHDFASIVPLLSLPKVRFVFPHAPVRPVTINAGYRMRAWYDIRTMERTPDRENAEHIRDAADRVAGLIAREVERGVPSERIVLAGFSQGGAIALHVAHRYPEPLCGLMALSTYLVLEDVWDAEGHPANAALPALVCHGNDDDVVPPLKGWGAYESLCSPGRDVRWHDFPMAHAVCDAELGVIRAWLHERFSAG